MSSRPLGSSVNRHYFTTFTRETTQPLRASETNHHYFRAIISPSLFPHILQKHLALPFPLLYHDKQETHETHQQNTHQKTYMVHTAKFVQKNGHARSREKTGWGADFSLIYPIRARIVDEPFSNLIAKEMLRVDVGFLNIVDTFATAYKEDERAVIAAYKAITTADVAVLFDVPFVYENVPSSVVQVLSNPDVMLKIFDICGWVPLIRCTAVRMAWGHWIFTKWQLQ